MPFAWGNQQRHFRTRGGRRFARGAGRQYGIGLHAVDESVTDGKIVPTKIAALRTLLQQ
jgi:hypothetical protein